MNCVNLVITGNPGVGKHTIADLFVKQDSSYQIFDINKFAIEKEFGEQVDDGIEVDTRKLKDEIQKLNLDKSLIVGHLAPYVLDESNIDFAIILRKNPYDLIEVYKKRKYKNSKMKENAGSEILGIITHDTIEKFEEKAFQIDVSNKKIQQVVEKVLDIISKKKGNEEVDWLSLVTKNNDLDKFFTH